MKNRFHFINIYIYKNTIDNGTFELLTSTCNFQSGVCIRVFIAFNQSGIPKRFNPSVSSVIFESD